MPSYVWRHFIKLDKTYAICGVETCSNKLSHLHGTTGMLKHLKGVHNITEENSVECDLNTEANKWKFKLVEDIWERKRKIILHELIISFCDFETCIS